MQCSIAHLILLREESVNKRLTLMGEALILIVQNKDVYPSFPKYIPFQLYCTLQLHQ